jgi:hypothetical protein
VLLVLLVAGRQYAESLQLLLMQLLHRVRLQLEVRYQLLLLLHLE